MRSQKREWQRRRRRRREEVRGGRLVRRVKGPSVMEIVASAARQSGIVPSSDLPRPGEAKSSPSKMASLPSHGMPSSNRVMLPQAASE